MDKKKGKLVNYFGYNVRQFQTVQNSIVSGLFGTVYVTTNLGVHKLYYQAKTNTITVDWSTPYKNSFIKNGMEKVASSSSTPAFIAERNELVVCDNDFPQVNMLVLDAKTGNIKQQFSLFEYAYGSKCTAISYANNTIVVSNSFGNATSVKDKDAYPASGVMKFTAYPEGKWRQDYDWTKLQYSTISNTAFSKISNPDQRAYLYHKGTGNWQVSSISLYKADIAYPILYSLQPDFTGVLKTDLNNYRSNFTIGPKKSLFVGTASGLLRIMSE
jgi:hypothetical protein